MDDFTTNIIYQNDESPYFRCLECSLIPEIKLNYYNNDNYEKKIQIHYKCENNHKGIIPINDFLNKSTYNDIYKVFCANNNNHQQKDRTSFIYCIDCEKFFCPECHLEHKNEHNKFCKINEFDYKCKIHNKSYSKYCFNCSKNICEECLNEHLNHNIKKIVNEINIEKYIDKIRIVNEYNNAVFNIINRYINYINKVIEKFKNDLIKYYEDFKNFNTLEITLCEKLIKIAKENIERKNNLNYNIINNLQLILNFNELNKDKLDCDLKKNNNIEYIISHSKTFLTNFNNLILKSSPFNYPINSLKKIKINKEDNNFILAGIKLFDNRIAFSFTNSNINIYDNNLKKNITIKLSEDEYGLCFYQLLNETLLVGTNFGYIYCISIEKAYKIQGKYSFNINERKLRIIKILNHPDKKKLIIVFEAHMIKIIDINNFKEEEKIIDELHNINITNAIFNNNKLILFSSKNNLIKFLEYSNNKFNVCQNEIQFSCIDWLEGVIIIDKERILAIGNEKLLLININNYQIKESYLNEQYISFYNMGNNTFLIGGYQKLIKGMIEGDEINIHKDKPFIIEDINEKNLIMKFVDMGNGEFVIGCQSGEIIKYQFRI